MDSQCSLCLLAWYLNTLVGLSSDERTPKVSQGSVKSFTNVLAALWDF